MPGVITHICNPSYLGGRDRRIAVQDQHKLKSSRILSQRTSWEWWFKPEITATQEAEVGGLWSYVGSGKNSRPDQKK
jgi:hypothetical protein